MRARTIVTALAAAALPTACAWTPSNLGNGPCSSSSSPAHDETRARSAESSVPAVRVGAKASAHTRNGVSRKAFIAGAAGIVASLPFVDPAQAATTSPSKSPYYEPAPGSLRGKSIVITGATTGLGLESAKRLAAAGATVVLTARTKAKGDAAVAAVSDYVTQAGIDDNDKPRVYSVVLDLDDLDNVRGFPDRLKAATGLERIDVLMNNAGVMAIPERQTTKDGYERTFQSNHLGHFVLTSELYDMLSRDGATVINVSSEGYQFATKAEGGQGLDLANLNGEVKYGPWSSYGQSKLSNILFTRELQRRADESGNTWLTAVSLHPGAVQTDLARNMFGEEKWNAMKNGADVPPLQMAGLKALSAFVKSVEDGASTQVYVASRLGDLAKGAFYTDMKPKKVQKYAQDDEAAKALWAKSEELGRVKFELK